MSKTRIELEDDLQGIIIKLSEGNPGAMNACIQIMKNPQIDPDNGMGSLSYLLLLDTYNIYGSNIWVLFSDICKQKVPYMMATLRACQLGLFDIKILVDASSRQDFSGISLVPIDDIYEKVKQRLPNFDN